MWAETIGWQKRKKYIWWCLDWMVIFLCCFVFLPVFQSVNLSWSLTILSLTASNDNITEHNLGMGTQQNWLRDDFNKVGELEKENICHIWFLPLKDFSVLVFFTF